MAVSVTELAKYMVRDKATRRDEATRTNEATRSDKGKKSVVCDHAKNLAMRSVNEFPNIITELISTIPR